VVAVRRGLRGLELVISRLVYIPSSPPKPLPRFQPISYFRFPVLRREALPVVFPYSEDRMLQADGRTMTRRTSVFVQLRQIVVAGENWIGGDEK
jgi:hypothetical protein